MAILDLGPEYEDKDLEKDIFDDTKKLLNNSFFRDIGSIKFGFSS